MTIAAITIWEGTPKGLQMLEEGSKQSAPIHEGMGAKNHAYGGLSQEARSIRRFTKPQFDNLEAYGKFNDALMKSDWWSGTQQWMNDNRDEIRNMGTTVLYGCKKFGSNVE